MKTMIPVGTVDWGQQLNEILAHHDRQIRAFWWILRIQFFAIAFLITAVLDMRYF